MSAAAQKHSANEASVAKLDAFRLRCWARACLVEHGMMFLHEAVDGLQDMAVSSALVEMLGQDAVQEVMAKLFGRWRDRTW
jgi:hypothetical protein